MGLHEMVEQAASLSLEEGERKEYERGQAELISHIHFGNKDHADEILDMMLRAHEPAADPWEPGMPL